MRQLKALAVYKSFILILLILILFTGTSIFGVKQMSHSVKNLQVHQAVSLQTSMELRRAYRDISFRMAAFSAGVLPAAGSQNRLRETSRRLQDYWPTYFQSIDFKTLPSDAPHLIENLKQSIAKGDAFIADLERSYHADERKLVLEMLQDRWPEIQASIMAPLDQLSLYHETAVHQSYQSVLLTEKYLIAFETLIFFIGSLLLFLIAKRMEKLKFQYEEQVNLNVSSSRLAALGEMAGGIAHEINTPLTVIQISAEQIQRALAKPELDQAAVIRSSQVIAKTTVRIDKIIKGLRSFARDGKNDPFQLEPIQRIIQETLDLCREKFHHLSISIEVSIPEQPLEIDCRPTQIAQVLLNVLNNSYDAIQGLTEKWIQIQVTPFEKEIEISITDSGSGIPQAVQLKLMQPFFTTKEIGRGTGLGLSVSRGIIESHSGSLFYDPDATHTRFVIRLPKHQPNEASQVVAKSRERFRLQAQLHSMPRWNRFRDGLISGFQILF